MEVKLYGFWLSPPVVAVHNMLEQKGVDHQVVELIPGFHPFLMRAHRFPEMTVPGLKIDGEILQRSISISREIDRRFPGPALYPSDPDQLARVHAAEEFNDEYLQDSVRRVARWGLRNQTPAMVWLARWSGLPVPRVAAVMAKPIIRWLAHRSDASAEHVRRDLLDLPGLLDQADALLAEGVIGGDPVNAADWQISATVNSYMIFPQLRPLIEARPIGQHALKRISQRDGTIPIEFPAEWLSGFDSAAPAERLTP